ncbi:GABA permease [Altererythrobacter sp. B11]|uniref:amino acid permease n=1 Tax=Altererythrobacter sp. B11 TaxID=2060312 RepID=UPI000DC6F4AB|nr:amino acid permease [Altererythrobacter sp. B11]BBC73997.1 GABA permease [Altererythrobacter sp. B11]
MTEPTNVPVSAAEVYPGEKEPELGRSLKARHVSMIAIGGIIGAGLFVGSSTSIASAGPAIILSYGLAGIIVLIIMRMLSEMAVAIPGVQSFPEFSRIGLGHWAGFLSGWLYWYFWVIVVAIEAIAGAVIMQTWIDLPVWLIGVVLTGLLTAVNLMSARSYGEFEFWFSSLKVVGIVVFIFVAGAYVLGFTSGTGPTFGNLTAHGGFAPNGGTAVLAATTSVIFALVGAEIATIAAAESAEPARTVARMTGTVALRILIFYILSILLIVSVTPWTSVVPGTSPFATALEVMGIPGAATIMNIIVLIAVLSCLNSGLYVTSRVLFTLAARGDAPQALVAVNRRQVPVRSILVASSFSYVALAASVLSPELVFSFLVNASGALMLIVYLMIAASQIRLRRIFENVCPERITIRTWFFPWLSYAGVLGIGVILLAMAITPRVSSEFWSSVGITLFFLVLFLVFRRGRAEPLDPLAAPKISSNEGSST